MKNKMIFMLKENILGRLTLIFVLSVLTLACSSDDDDDDIGNWVERSVLDGTPRSGAFAFTVGNIGYAGTGFDGDDRLSDVWAYDMTGNFWFQLADFPGIPRSSTVSFVVNGNAYVGLGFDGDDELGDFFEYNISGNTWDSISSFGGTPRRGAIAFNSTTHGYVGTGFDGDNDLKDFWKYDPTTDTWNEIVGFGGEKRRDGAIFTIGDLVYLGTGVSNGLLQEDFWEFNLQTESWRPLTDLDDDDDDFIMRTNAVGFSIGDRGYFATGDDGFGASTEVWEYNPSTDLWEEKTEHEGTTRQGAVAFYNGITAFVALGRSGNLYLDDNWEFFPDEEEDEDD